MKSLLLSKKTEQTSSSLNLKSITKAKKHFQKFSYKPLIASSEFERHKNKHMYFNTDNLEETVKKINFQDSIQINNNICNTNENINNHSNSKSKPKKILPKFNKNNNNFNLQKNDKKKNKNSIDLQNRYTNIINKNYYRNTIKEKEYNLNLYQKKNISVKKYNNMKNLKKSVISNKEKTFYKNFQGNNSSKDKEKIMKKSFTPSTLRTEESEKIIIDESKNKESIILSSISTFKTLFNVKEKKERIISKEQKNELKELTNKLKLIGQNKIKKDNKNIETKFNIINADMLQDNSSNNYLNNEKEINEEIITSSEQRIQTYTLLLNCISKKFKEIEDLLDKDEEKISELHSNIEFSNNYNNTNINNINTNITQTNTNNNINNNEEYTNSTIINYDDVYEKNSCDCNDDEIEEKTNIIIPKGVNIINDNKNLNNNNINNIGKINGNTLFQDSTFLSLNSEILLKNLNENNNSNINSDLLSFLSNDMISFFQTNNNYKINDINELKDKIPKKENKDKNNDNNCEIF